MLQPDSISKADRQESYGKLTLIALGYRDFRLFWTASFAEHLGEFMEIAAILWLVNELTHSPLMLTITGSIRFLAMIFLPVLGGIVADRMNRRIVMIVALAGSLFLSILLAIMAFTQNLSVWYLIIINLLGGIAMSFNHPARFAMLPNLIKREHLLNAMSLDQVSTSGSMMLGMLLSGYIIANLGVAPIFILRIAGCLIAIICFLMASIPPTPPDARKQAPLQNLADGLHYMRTNMIIVSLIVLSLLPMLIISTWINFIPIFASDILHVGAVYYGYLQAAPGLGAMIALIGLATLTYYKRKAILLVISVIIMGVGLIAFSASSVVYLSLVLLALIGMAQAAFFAVTSTIIQGAVPDEVRGRILSWREITSSFGPLISIAFGAIAQHTRLQTGVAVLGGICLVTALVLIIFLPKFRTFE